MALNNVTATADPGVTNDASQGYSVASIWVNTTTKDVFVCADATAGAAIWVSAQDTQHPGYVVGRYYATPGASTQTQLLTENRLYLMPIQIRRKVTADQLAINISVAAGGALWQVKMGIWKSNGAGVAGALLIDGGFLTIGANTGDLTKSISQVLNPGSYHLGVISNRNGDASATAPTLRAINFAENQINGSATAIPVLATGVNDVTPGTWATFTLPDPAPATTFVTNQNPPVISFRAA